METHCADYVNPVQLHTSVSVVQSADRISSDCMGSSSWEAAKSKLEMPRCFKVVSQASHNFLKNQEKGCWCTRLDLNDAFLSNSV